MCVCACACAWVCVCVCACFVFVLETMKYYSVIIGLTAWYGKWWNTDVIVGG